MSLGLFDSVKGGMFHYFIRPEDKFVLHSLEKVGPDMFLLRLLRDAGFQVVYFIVINEDSCSVVVYDKLSYWATQKPEAFSSVDVQDAGAVEAFFEQAEGRQEEKAGPDLKYKRVTTRKPAKKEIPQVGRCQVQRFATAEEFEGFMLNRISPALNRQNAKTAVVLPMEIFERNDYITDVTVATFRRAQRNNDAKENLIVLTTPRKENLVNLLDFSPYRNLHYWVVEVLNSLPSGQWRAAAALEALKKEGVLVQADGICADEIENLLLRKKLVERDPRFAKLPVTKIFGLAELLAEHCRMEQTHFKSFESFKMHDYIRQLEKRLERDAVVEELLEKAATLKPRIPKSLEGVSPLALERVTGQPVVRAERSQEELLHDYEAAMQKLQSLVGLTEVKEKLQRKLNTLRTFGKGRGPGHFMFTGDPGCGKTEVARLLGQIFKAMGLLRKGHVVECKKADLVAGYLGQTAIKTRKKCEEALDGVLFIDEAYSLVNTEPNGQKFASEFDEEAYTEIMTFMEEYRDRVCVVFAGYADKMRYFREANPGMASRLGKQNVIHFPNYNARELFQILKLFAEADEDPFTMTPEFETAICRVIEDMLSAKDENFGNGRQMRELFDACKDCAAERFVRTGDESTKYTLTAEDIPQELRYSVSEEELQTAMQELWSLIGLDSVKEKLERQLNVVRAYHGKNGPGHYIFTGNPGTGKTEVARLLGKIFKAMGLLRKGHLVECKKADLVAGFLGQTPLKTRAKCREALDGVLFIDEAYDFVNTEPNGVKFKTSFDEEAYNELMTFMENNRKRICVIFAGYPDQMRCFRDANPGMASRVGESNIIPFPDYGPEELFRILERFAGQEEPGFTLAEDFRQEIRQVIAKLVKGKRENFGNARDMRELFERCKECAAQRTVHMAEEDRYTLLREDIPGEFYPRASQTEFEQAMAELNEMVGLGKVKEALNRILDMKLIYEDERCPGHYVFAGNPGTGKTVVARLLGKIFKAMGLLHSGHVVECRKADLVMGGQTALKTRARLESALDGVFFLDEAYELVETDATGMKFKTSYDEEAYTEIMAFMENNRHRVCVIFAGYNDLMEKFLDANDGMRSRVSEVIRFPDYTEGELVQIMKRMAKREGFSFEKDMDPFIRRAITARRRECAGKFANGREIRDLFVCFKQNLASRMKQLRYENRLEELAARKYIIMPEDTLVGSMREQRVSLEEALAELSGMIGLKSVKDAVRDLANRILYPADPTKGTEPGHYVFAGNPGTGKTEVARLLGKILKAIGVLPRGHVVEVSRSSLVAGYVGQTAIKTLERCREAIGGVLFVDEAYMLLSRGGQNDFGKEALDTIMKFMEDNRDRVCVVFAGYEAPMRELMDSNEGFNSRITQVIPFPDYTAGELVEIMHYMADKQKLQLSDEFVAEATAMLESRVQHKDKNFGNAREVRKLLSMADGNRAGRIAEAVSRGETVSAMQMNLLVAEDLGSRTAAVDRTAGKASPLPVYQRIPGQDIRQLQPLYGEEALESRVTLAAATDSAVLFVETDRGYGTAFLISPDGYALTCNHVISETKSIRARLRIPGRPGGDDSWHECRVINTKMDLDMALIKLEGSNFPYLSLATEQRRIWKGEDIILSGYPFGSRTSKDLTTFSGYVASSEKQTDENDFIRYNINCEAKRGDSGAPVIALSDGRVIGILLGSMTEGRGTGLTEEINYMRPVRYFWEEFVE